AITRFAGCLRSHPDPGAGGAGADGGLARPSPFGNVGTDSVDFRLGLHHPQFSLLYRVHRLLVEGEAAADLLGAESGLSEHIFKRSVANCINAAKALWVAARPTLRTSLVD